MIKEGREIRSSAPVQDHRQKSRLFKRIQNFSKLVEKPTSRYSKNSSMNTTQVLNLQASNKKPIRSYFVNEDIVDRNIRRLHIMKSKNKTVLRKFMFSQVTSKQNNETPRVNFILAPNEPVRSKSNEKGKNIFLRGESIK